MYVDPSKVEAIAVALEYEDGHPVGALFTWFPWLGGVAAVRRLFHLMIRTFGERLRLARVNGYLRATESLHAQEIRWLMDRFQRECPVDVIDLDERVGKRSKCNLRALYSQALNRIGHADVSAEEIGDARHQVVLVFCQLLLAIGLSPTAP